MDENKMDLGYMVWRVEELVQVTTKAEMDIIMRVIDRILRKREEEGKKPLEPFLVVELDEPYAEEVKEILKKHGRI
ncbi:hypothetical protein 015DV002_81 [Bacillus phage 015DV002]|nr:hypothetical protein 000TH008_93 [Bacillus phage 000TH008]QQO40787.1 hypothetical protein 000TH009_93 [Bacillus phage 000TH009]QQO41035.1 hypothetical protein 015DV002_81 [Bacillus phage 015DV002]QQO41312.1 hypothetical protein 015DV004_96 [Bacillus phage 015DV004]